MKHLTLCLMLTSLVFAPSSYAHPHEPAPISDYGSLQDTLTHGNKVRVILQLDKCSSPDTEKSMRLAGGLDFSNFVIYPVPEGALMKMTIATSTTMLVHHRTLGPVLNYVRLRIFENNTAEVLSELMNPSNYTILQTNSYTCELSTNQDIHGVMLYKIF